MENTVYKVIELTGSSPAGIEDAIKNAVERASKTLKNLRWFKVLETKGSIEDNKVSKWQATIKIAFAIEDTDGEE